MAAMPQKRHFRQRAHANIFSDHQLEYPLQPQDFNWSRHYPAFIPPPPPSPPVTPPHTTSKGITPLPRVEFADIGCGFGGLLTSLSPLFPETLILGMEIRAKVEEYVFKRIESLRATAAAAAIETSKTTFTSPTPPPKMTPGPFQNISVMRMNAQKFLPNFFVKGQLSKMFILFPDPHFKKRKHKARMVTSTSLTEFAHVIRPGGLLYMVTDVQDLFDWMVRHAEEHPLFERIEEGNAELAADPCIPCIMEGTEEGKKVTRNQGSKWLAVYRRIAFDHDAAVSSASWDGFDPIFTISAPVAAAAAAGSGGGAIASESE